MDIQTRLENTFLAFLVRERAIKTNDVETIRTFRRGFATPLGRLALQKGYLNMKQVTVILDAQLESSRSFGRMALDLGLLDRQQLDELLSLQDAVLPSLSAIIGEMGLVDAGALEALTTDFVLSTAKVVC